MSIIGKFLNQIGTIKEANSLTDNTRSSKNKPFHSEPFMSIEKYSDQRSPLLENKKKDFELGLTLVALKTSEKRPVFLYDEEERQLLKNIDHSLMIMKMSFNMGKERCSIGEYVARNLTDFIILDPNKTRKEYLYRLSTLARAEAGYFAGKMGFESFEALGKKWKLTGKDLGDEALSQGYLAEQFAGKLQNILGKYARKAKASQIIQVTKLPEIPTRVEKFRYQVHRVFVKPPIPCGSFEEACSLARLLTPAFAKDEKDGTFQSFT